MSLLQTIVLALIEGITEFLPISSTGHMMMASALMGIPPDSFTRTFIVAIQLGAILSVVVLYTRRFFQSLTFYFKLFVAFVPAAIAGLLFGDAIDTLLGRVDVVGYALIAGGVVFLFVDKVFRNSPADDSSEVSYPVAFKIGLCQVLALVPGVSRSAATIIGGLSQKLTRQRAAEFSFFLAVPTMFAATAYKLFSFVRHGNTFTHHDLVLLAVGNVVAFLVGALSIRWLIRFLTGHGFRLFGYYRLLAGAAILLAYYLGYGLNPL